MPALKPRPYYQTIAQFREFDRAFPIFKLNWAVPDLPSSHLHFHNGLEFGYCRSGQGIFVIADKVRPFRAGDVSVIDRSERHYAQSAPGVKSDWTWAQMDVIALLAPMCRDIAVVDPSALCGPAFPNVFSPGRYPLVCELVRRFFDELWSAKPQRELRVRTIVLDLMLELSRMPQLRGTGVPLSVHSAAERVAPALEYIAAHYQEELRVERLARLCNLGATRFRRLFQLETGKTPQRYIIEMRVGMACAMLTGSTRPVGRVAAECGFVTLSSFNRAFRAITGASPRQWRRER